MLGKFISDQRGATSIEYALVASLVSIAIIGALLVFQESMGGMFQHISDNISPRLSSGG